MSGWIYWGIICINNAMKRFLSFLALITAIAAFLQLPAGLSGPAYARSRHGRAGSPVKTQRPGGAGSMDLIFVKGGCFKMGDTFGSGNADERPVHEVCVNDFYMGKYVVTQGQWKDIMGEDPALFGKCGDDCPVDDVSWNEIQEFIDKLNARTGKRYRLPTEAEWEYAARSGGKNEKWSGTSDEAALGKYAWYDSNANESIHPVGKKKPNGLGLYDMSGNVWQWCYDRYDEGYYTYSRSSNPAGPTTGQDRVLRGGSWFNGPKYLRTAARLRFDPARPYVLGGFRLVAPFR